MSVWSADYVFLTQLAPAVGGTLSYANLQITPTAPQPANQVWFQASRGNNIYSGSNVVPTSLRCVMCIKY